MTSVEYDLDTSGGLMPQIQALIAPPVSEDNSKVKKKDAKDMHPYYKRPGRGHNRDCCDACGEGGGLLCCDKCPASFHFMCHDPPLDEADLPVGEWLCRSCRVRAAKAVEADGPTSGAKGESGRDRLLDGHKEITPEDLPATGEKRKREPSPALGPLDMLVQAANLLNPRQFELPRELSTSLPFPGTDKNPVPTRTAARRGSSIAKKKPHELDNGMVPLPARVCFECRRSCRKAPLLACDYCPLLFHLDCLDPPLTSLPAGHWMCPNHPENFVDSNLLTSCSASERLQLWDRYAGPIDQDAIKIEFIRKARRQYPPFRFKVKLPPRNTVRVPDAVKAHYAHPPELIPSLRSCLRTDAALASKANYEKMAQCNASETLNDSASTVASPHEQEHWLTSVISLQTSIACHLGSRRKLPNGESASPPNGALLWGEEKREATPASHEKPRCSPIPEPKLSTMSAKVLAALLETSKALNGSTTASDLSCLDDRLVKLLALQRLQQLLPKAASATASTTDTPSISPPPPPPSRPSSPPRESRVRSRALLCPMKGPGRPVPMPYRTLSIGTGADNDVVLSSYGRCNYVSSHHASIFFDENTQHFELLNYSEHGTTVDNVLFSCDFSDKPVSKSDKEENACEDLAAAVRAELNRKIRQTSSPPSEQTCLRMAPDSGKDPRSCSCRASSSSLIGSSGAGWEGTALLSHGSYVRFGCLQFVFSVTNFAPSYRFLQSNPPISRIKQEPKPDP